MNRPLYWLVIVYRYVFFTNTINIEKYMNFYIIHEYALKITFLPPCNEIQSHVNDL